MPGSGNYLAGDRRDTGSVITLARSRRPSAPVHVHPDKGTRAFGGSGRPVHGTGPVGSHPAGSCVHLVLAADDHGRLRLPPAGANLAAPELLILVGGLTNLGELADGLLRGAGAVVNADLPFFEVLDHVDSALRAGPLQPDSRDQLHRRIRQRKAESDRFEQLTDREAAVLADLAAGLAAADIARMRPVALTTVRTQINGILRKLEVPSQTAAVALTYQACHDQRVLTALRPRQNYK